MDVVNGTAPNSNNDTSSQQYVSVQLAIPLAGGEWFSGVAFAITLPLLFKFGLRAGIIDGKKRQILLNIICFICAINTIISVSTIIVKQLSYLSIFICSHALFSIFSMQPKRISWLPT